MVGPGLETVEDLALSSRALGSTMPGFSTKFGNLGRLKGGRPCNKARRGGSNLAYEIKRPWRVCVCVCEWE